MKREDHSEFTFMKTLTIELKQKHIDEVFQ